MNELREASLLFLDCQTTGPFSNGGALLETAWRLHSHGRVINEFSSRIRLAEGVTIPLRVRKLTGLRDVDLADGICQNELRERLLNCLESAEDAKLIIHYARFERPFLQDLLSSQCPRSYCTYEMARRLLPGLPSFSIAALAGYFGLFLDKRNKALHHVAATEVILNGLLTKLEQHGITNFSKLNGFLDSPVSTKSEQKTALLMPRSLRLGIAEHPGVYRFLDSRGRVLYIGKATSLKARVNSYFRSRKGIPTHRREMLTQIADVDTTLCPSAVHAALLECSEIQRCDPPYNRSLKLAGRRLAFYDRGLQQLSSDWSSAFPIGPFPGSWIIENLHHLFKLLTCPADDSAAALFRTSVDESDLQRGLELFKQRLLPHSPKNPRDMLALGIAFARRSPDSNADNEDEQEAEEVIRFSPPDICKRCESVLTNTGRQYCRTRKLTKLLQAEVCWQEAEQTMTVRLEDYGIKPSKSGAWSDLGVAAFDLARVLLTEIHRLRSAGVHVRTLKPGVGLRLPA